MPVCSLAQTQDSRVPLGQVAAFESAVHGRRGRDRRAAPGSVGKERADAAPCQQYRCHLEKNASQMAAISWRFTLHHELVSPRCQPLRAIQALWSEKAGKHGAD